MAKNPVHRRQNCKIGIKMVHVHRPFLYWLYSYMGEGCTSGGVSREGHHDVRRQISCVALPDFKKSFELVHLVSPVPDPVGLNARPRTKGALSKVA